MRSIYDSAREKHEDPNLNPRQRRLWILILAVFTLVLLAIAVNERQNGNTTLAQAQVRNLANAEVEKVLPLQSQTPSQTSKPSSSPSASPTATFQPASATPTAEERLSATPGAILAANAYSWSSLGSGTIYFSQSEGGYTHLFAYNPQSLPFTRLTNGNWDDIAPAASPDGARLAFSSNRNGHWDIYVLSLVDGKLIQVTNTAEYDGAPSWSPDSLWLVYESYAVTTHLEANPPQSAVPPTPEPASNENLELFILQLNLESPNQPAPIRLTDNSSADYSPAWAPSGRQIAFISDRSGEADVWLADLDQVDGRFRDVSNSPLSLDRNPAWSPDGKSLAWASAADGYTNIYVMDDVHGSGRARQIGNGSQPVWSPDGQILVTWLESPNRDYLTGFAIYHEGLALAPIPLPGTLRGITWGRLDLANPLPEVFSQAARVTATPAWQAVITPLPNIPGARQHVVPLNDVKVSYPFLHDMVDESFTALRKELATRIGWDYMSTLENAYVPLTSPLSPGMLEDWLYTGRAFRLLSVPINAGWLVVTREDFGSDTYWRLFVRTRFQDGSQGLPLHDLPWNFNARFSGDPRFYEQGGALVNSLPSGYWLDLTRLARDFGWERLPALATWQSAFQGARFNELALTAGLDWRSAMLELYPEAAIATPTRLSPATQTPTSTRWPTRTPTSTRTPWPTHPQPTTTATP